MTTTRTMSQVATGPRVNILGGTVKPYAEPTSDPGRDEARSNTQYVDLRSNSRTAIVQEIVEYLKALYK